MYPESHYGSYLHGKLGNMYRLTVGQIPTVCVGGISSGQDALEMIVAGALAVHTYYDMAFEGHVVATRMRRELEICGSKGFIRVQ